MSRFSLPWRSLSVTAVVVLAGCATVSQEQNLERVNEEIGDFSGGKVSMTRTAKEREAQARTATDLLKLPLGQ